MYINEVYMDHITRTILLDVEWTKRPLVATEALIVCMLGFESQQWLGLNSLPEWSRYFLSVNIPLVLYENKKINLYPIKEVSRFYLTKILMHCWLVTWQHVSGPKQLHVRYMHIHKIIFNQTALLFKSGQTVLLFKPRGQTAYCWLMRWHNHVRPNCF